MKLFGRAFQQALRLSAALTRDPRTARAGERLNAWAGAALARLRGVRPATAPRALAEQWQRAMPSPRAVPITHVTHDTAHAEIHVRCPLRGTGDVAACHRMMAYDRAFAARAGASFTVLQSQAEPGVTVCRVALRRADLPTDDLVPAHLRAARTERP